MIDIYNNKTPKILFLSGISYLSNPRFFNIADKMDGFELIYLYTKDSFNILSGLGMERVERNEILKHFHIFDEVNDFQEYRNLKNGGRIESYKRFDRYIKGVEKKLDQYNADCIFSASDMYLSQRTAIKWCKKHRKPFIILQPALLQVEEQGYNLKHRLKYLIFNRLLSRPIYRRSNVFGNEDKVTHLLLWGEYFKVFYKNKKKNVHVVGDPALDKVLQAQGTQLKVTKTADNDHKKIVLICSDYSANLVNLIGKEVAEKTIKLWFKTIKNNSNLKFIIKLHPGDDTDLIEQYFKKLANVEIVSNVNLYDLFKISDVQISVNSASSYEAIGAGLPIILTNLDKSGKLPDFFHNDIELKATSVKQLTIMIRKALSLEYLREFRRKRELFIKNRLFSMDGKSAERIAKKIKDIMVGKVC